MLSTVGPLTGCGLLLLGICGSAMRVEGTLAVTLDGEIVVDYLLIVSALAAMASTITSNITVCLLI